MSTPRDNRPTMLLTPTNLVHYLTSRGSIARHEPLDGPIRVLDSSRRNRNFKVLRPQAPGLFVKQASGPHAAALIRREAACHRIARAHPDHASLRDLMPRPVDHDPPRAAITVELLQPGEDFRQVHARIGSLPAPVARSLGQAIGRLHAASPRLLSDPDALAPFPRQAPWILDAHRDLGAPLPDSSPAQARLIAAIRDAPELAYGLGGLRMAWAHPALIHGDLKCDNLMAIPGGDGEGLRLRVVDWELADLGEPAWDLASLLATCLEPHLLRQPDDRPHPGTAGEHPNDALALAPARPALAACWAGYAEALTPPAGSRQAARDRGVHHLGAKLLLIAYELLAGRSEPSPIADRLARLARSIMVDPPRAGRELLGLD